MKKYLSDEYTAAIDEIVVDPYQLVFAFEYDKPNSTNPKIYLKEGWYGIGSLSQLAFTNGVTITATGSAVEVVNITGVSTITFTNGVVIQTSGSGLNVTGDGIV